MLVITLFSIGLIVGLVSTFFGIGGGSVIVPALYYLFKDIPPAVTIGTSISLICINSTLNFINYLLKGKKFQPAITFQVGLSMALGVMLSGIFIGWIPPGIVKKIFGSTLLFIVARNFYSHLKKKGTSRMEESEAPTNKNCPVFIVKCIGSGLSSGIISGMTGLGGGASLIPFLAGLLKVSYKDLPFLSNASMVFSSFAGSITYMLKDESFTFPATSGLGLFQVGSVNWGIVLLLFSGSMLTSRLGVKLNMHLPAKVIFYLFTAMLLALSMRMFTS